MPAPSKGYASNTSNFLIFLFVVIIFMMMMFRGKNVLKRLLSGAMKQLLRDFQPPPFKYPHCACSAGVCKRVKGTYSKYYFICPIKQV